MQQDAPSVDVQITPRPAPQTPVSRESLELGTLQARRAELKEQFNSIGGRRALLVAQMAQSDGAAEAELRTRIGALDKRADHISNELNEVDDRISALIAAGVTPPPSGFDRLMQGAFGATPTPPPQTIAVARVPSDPFKSEWGVLFGGMVLMQGLTLLLLAVVVWRSFVRPKFARLAGDDANRLDQLQRSVDVMAVEVERISESQRFTAKMLNEQVAEPVRVGKEEERVR